MLRLLSGSQGILNRGGNASLWQRTTPSEQCSPHVRQVFDGEAAERFLGATVLWTREDVPVDLLHPFLEQWQIDQSGRRRRIVEVQC
jgi:hypothetical protein